MSPYFFVRLAIIVGEQLIKLVNFEENKLVVAMRIAQVISRQFDEGKCICADDVKDFATPASGFAEKDEA